MFLEWDFRFPEVKTSGRRKLRFQTCFARKPRFILVLKPVSEDDWKQSFPLPEVLTSRKRAPRQHFAKPVVFQGAEQFVAT